MRKITVNLDITLDGVIQAPARPDEDRRGGFEYGGWGVPYVDAVMSGVAAEGIAKGPSFLFGRWTYEDFYAVWPSRGDSPFSELFNNAQKYVVSRTLEEPLPWQNSTLLKGEAATTVAELKRGTGGPLVILGSGTLVRSLMKHRLIDEFVFNIHPLVLGAGQRLFDEESPFTALQLVETTVTTTGVIIATYRPVEPATG